MKTYTLSFKAIGKTNTISDIQSDEKVISIAYKTLVDYSISNWIDKNKLDGKTLSIIDIYLHDQNQNLVYSQGNWNDLDSINPPTKQNN